MAESTSKSPDQAGFSADRPIADPKDDKLGFANFAKHVASGLAKSLSHDGMVVGVYAPWGAGKTTFLNFVCHYVCQLAGDKKPVVVKYNPWWFAGDESLARSFFEQLQVAIGQVSKSKKARESIAAFGERLSNVPGFVPHVAEVGKALGAFKPAAVDVVKLKEQVSDVLSTTDKRILVVIDDIDRLAAGEIKQLFRLIRAVADFPNVTYLLAFDRTVVEKALADSVGDKYLEKIVQVQFHLPVPDQLSMQKWFIESLQDLVIDVPEERFDRDRWASLFHGGLIRLIRVPRDVTRIINALSVTLPSVIDEVDVLDFVALEVIRILHPWLYDRIQSDPELFVGPKPILGRNEDREKATANLEGLLSRLNEIDRHPIEVVLSQLFPTVSSLLHNRIREHMHDHEARINRRVCDHDSFPVYFQFGVSKWDVTRVEYSYIQSIAPNVERTTEEILRLNEVLRPDGYTRAYVLLRMIAKDPNSVDSEAVPHLVQCIVNVADQIWKSNPSGFLMESGGDLATSSIGTLVRSLEISERTALLQSFVCAGESLALISEFLIRQGWENGRYTSSVSRSDNERLVSAEVLDNLVETFLRRVNDIAGFEYWFQIPNLPVFLHNWNHLSGKSGVVRGKTSEILRQNEGVMLVLRSFLQVKGNIAPSGYNRADNPGYFMNNFLDVVDIDYLRQRVDEFSTVNPDENELYLLDLFKKAHDMHRGEQ